MTDEANGSVEGMRDSLGSDYEVDIEPWIERFPIDRDAILNWNWSNIAGVAVMEQFKRQLRKDLGPFEEVRTDLFVLAIGEPRRRDVTKIGGLPYRPAHLPWPTTADGQPMTFVAQYRFAESRDHLGPTPSDMLLIFIETYAPFDGECTDQFHFEWHPLGLADLVRSSDVPPPAFEFVTCYGVRHRTTCVVDPRAIDHVKHLILERDTRTFPDLERAEYLCFVGGAKIGGVPIWNRGYDPPFEPPGRFLCSLHAIYPDHDVEYPWINQAEPVPIFKSLAESLTMEFGDSSILNFFIDDAGAVRCTLQFA